MIQVAYAKFYQAVTIGTEMLTHIAAQTKPKGVKITWDQGLMRVEKPGARTVFVPTANIMFFHELEAEAEEAPRRGRPPKTA